MANNKYGKYIVPAPIMQSVMFPQIKAPQINIGGGQLHGIALTMNWSYLTEPFVMVDKSHAHEFDQVIVFLGGDPTTSGNLAGKLSFISARNRKSTSLPPLLTFAYPGGSFTAR